MCHSVCTAYVDCARSTYHVGCLSANLVLPHCVPGGSELRGDEMCSVCAWAMLADSDMSPVYTLPLGTVCISDVLPAGEAPSQGLEEAWTVSEGHQTQSRGWVVWSSGSEQ